MDFPTLETTRLKLVEVEPQHAEALFQILSRDEVTKYYAMNPLTSVEEAAKIIESFRKNGAERRGIRWGMVRKDTEEMIGTLGLNNLQLWNKRAEIGYETHPNSWRSGYTSEAVREVLRYSFTDLGLYRMGAVTFPQNTASRQLLVKLGFQEEGVLRGYLYQNAASHDASLYSLLKPEWEKSHDA